MVKIKMRNGINHIDKLDFLEVYPLARIEAFKSETIKNSFRVAGLVPFTPERVISKLNIRLRTPTPPPSRGSDWDPKTPSNYIQLEKQASSIKVLLRIRSKSPLSPLNSAINQVLKAYQITMQSAALLEKEMSDLRAENEKKKQKRTRSIRTIVHEGDLLVQEVRELRSEPFKAQVARINNYRERVSEGLRPPPQAGRACGICRKPGHRRETCPDR
jgi:hypothetical protein